MEFFKRHKFAIVMIAIVVILVAAAIYYAGMYARLQLSHIRPPPAVGPLSFNIIGVSHSNFLSYSNSKFIVAYTLLNYTASNASSLNITFNLYTSKPTYNIYLVNTSGTCYQCYNIADINSSLESDLGKFDLLYNGYFKMVSLAEIQSIPPKSIVIIPSGLMPIELMPNTGYSYSTTLLTLLNRGDIVIYIGDNFSRSIGPNNIIFQSSASTSAALAGAGITYSKFAGTLAGGGGIYSLSFSSPKYMLPGGMYYAATYVNSLNGTLIAFSNTPDYGWHNASDMAMDIARIIGTRFWLTPIASGTYSIVPQHNGTVGLFTLNKTIASNSTSGQALNSTYPFVQVVAYNSTTFKVRDISFRMHWQTNGSISVQASVPETALVPVVISMNTGSAYKRTIVPNINVYNQQMELVETVPVGFFNTSSNISIIKYIPFSMPPGQYILLLTDISNRYYASATFNLEGVSISPVTLNFKNGTFIFSLSSGGIPINNTPYTINLNGAYQSSGTVYNGTIFYKLPRGVAVSYGTQNFNINIFSSNFTYSYSYIKEIFHIPAYYIEFAIVIIAIIVLNLILKAPNRDEYYIDLPDFMPSNKVSVTVKRDDILALFDKANYYYKWRYMPLTLEEVKSNITTNMRYGNMPISVTTQNTRIVLSQLVEEGSLLEVNNYYTPARWVKESGHDEEYLTVFRIIRDFCVTHGMLFTDLNASELADMVVTKSGSERYIIIYTSKGKMRSIRIGTASKVYIVFIDEETMRTFIEKLYASVGEEAELLRIGISNGSIKLVDTRHLDEII